jgi:hypothetical protein
MLEVRRRLGMGQVLVGHRHRVPTLSASAMRMRAFSTATLLVVVGTSILSCGDSTEEQDVAPRAPNSGSGSPEPPSDGGGTGGTGGIVDHDAASKAQGGVHGGGAPGIGGGANVSGTPAPEGGIEAGADASDASREPEGPETGPETTLPPPPDTCASDNDCTPSGMLCNTFTNVCVNCLSSAQCGPSEDCLDGKCEPYTSCTSSLDCVGSTDGKTVCHAPTERCVECVIDADCSGTDVCFENRCECGNLDNDRNNCGVCGHYCPTGCSGGRCIPTWAPCSEDNTAYASCNAFCASKNQDCATRCSPLYAYGSQRHCGYYNILSRACDPTLAVRGRFRDAG